MPGGRCRACRIDLEALQRLGSRRWILSGHRISTRVLGRPRVFHDGRPGGEIDSRLERAGFDKEERAFRAHLTLARAKDNRLESALVKAAAQFAETEFGTFIADRCLSLPKHAEAGRPRLHEAEGIPAVTPLAIIGAGGWGTALAVTQARAQRPVRLWVYEPDLAEAMVRTRENASTSRVFRFRRRCRSAIRCEEVAQGCGVVIVAVPSHFYRSVAKQLLPLLQRKRFS